MLPCRASRLLRQVQRAPARRLQPARRLHQPDHLDDEIIARLRGVHQLRHDPSALERHARERGDQGQRDLVLAQIQTRRFPGHRVRLGIIE